jgi:hypothetical protein
MKCSQFSLTQAPSSRKPIVVPGAFSRLSSVPDFSHMRRMYGILEHSAQKQQYHSISLCSHYFDTELALLAINLILSTKLKGVCVLHLS